MVNTIRTACGRWPHDYCGGNDRNFHPTGQWPPAVACERLLKNYERLTEYLESTPDLRQHVRESPPLKAVSNGAFEYMDGYQWVLAAAAHTERHTKQILEVKSDSNFPAN